MQRYLSLVLPDLFDREDYDPQVLAISDTLQHRAGAENSPR